MGFNQRQAAGKFTREEADTFIAGLQDTTNSDADAPPISALRLTAKQEALRQVPTDQLAAELQRRGWVVMEP